MSIFTVYTHWKSGTENIALADDIDRVIYLIKEATCDEVIDALTTPLKVEEIADIQHPFHTEQAIRDALVSMTETGEQITIFVNDATFDNTKFLIQLMERPCHHDSLLVYSIEEGSDKYHRKSDGTFTRYGSTEYFEGWVTGARCEDCGKEWGDGDGGEQELADLINQHIHKSIGEPEWVASPKSAEKNTR